MKLNDQTLLRSRCYSNGDWIDADTGEVQTIINPATDSQITTVPIMGQAETARAIQAAYKAQQAWKAVPAIKRTATLMHWHQLIITHTEDLAQIITAEMGKPLPEARSEVAYGASYIEWYAEEAKRIYGSTIPAQSNDTRIMVIRQPIGVVASITPWNFPNAMVCRKIAPALAVGCSVVMKPAEETPLSALALCVLAERAGFPPGLLNCITGNPEKIGREMTDNPIVRKLTFTGSTHIGRHLMQHSAASIKKLGLELGGHAPFIVFGDADVDAAVTGAMACKFRNGGQTCISANRFYIHDTIYDTFARKLAAHVSTLTVGNGAQDGVNQGPLINKDAVEKVEDHLADAVSKGAHILCGGKRHTLGGTFFEPTILIYVTQDMKIAHEETFGPVAPLFKVTDTEDIIHQANDTIYGLASYFYTKDIQTVFRVAESLEYGMVAVNTGILSNAAAPFGGIKQSGLGREGSVFGLDDYLELKYILLGGM